MKAQRYMLTNYMPSITATDICSLEGGTQVVHLSKSCKCKRYSIRGVRAKDIDILVDERLTDTDKPLVEIIEKRGKYDHATRDRLTFRASYPEAGAYDVAEFSATEHPHGLTLKIITSSGSVVFRKNYRRLTSEVDRSDPISLARMLTTHAFGKDGVGGYFRHLDWQSVDSCANEYIAKVLDNPQWTKVECYQEAGRILYRESRNLGWRKMTLRERIKHGLADSGQWHRNEILLAFD